MRVSCLLHSGGKTFRVGGREGLGCVGDGGGVVAEEKRGRRGRKPRKELSQEDGMKNK